MVPEGSAECWLRLRPSLSVFPHSEHTAPCLRQGIHTAYLEHPHKTGSLRHPSHPGSLWHPSHPGSLWHPSHPGSLWHPSHSESSWHSGHCSFSCTSPSLTLINRAVMLSMPPAAFGSSSISLCALSSGLSGFQFIIIRYGKYYNYQIGGAASTELYFSVNATPPVQLWNIRSLHPDHSRRSREAFPSPLQTADADWNPYMHLRLH